MPTEKEMQDRVVERIIKPVFQKIVPQATLVEVDFVGLEVKAPILCQSLEEPEGYLVLTRYKGHHDSRVVQNEVDIRKIKAVEEVHPPGTWHYDPETGTPVPGSD